MTGPLLGRERELEAFAAALARAARGFVVAVAGEPGIGKTRLLDELAAMVTTVGGTVLAGRTTDASPRVVADVLHDHDLRTVAAAGRLPRPVCLLLDDVHLADRDSWQPIRRASAGLLVAVAYRPRQAPPELERVVHQAVADGNGVLVEPRPLSPAEVATLANGREVSGLHRRSGGNPFYVDALLRISEDAEFPASVRGAFEREFAALTDVDRLVLQASAVAGERFDVGLVAAIAGLNPAETRWALRRLAARDLVRGAPDRHRHPLLRAAAYAGTPPGWRLAAHGRAAAELTGRNAQALAKAPHLEQAAEPGDSAAVEVLTEAAHESAGTAPAEAAHWLGVALALLPDRPESADQRISLTVFRARLLISSGRLADGRTLLLGALRNAAGATRTRAVLCCALAERMLGRHAEARARLQAELDAVAEPAARIELYLELTAGWVVGGQQAEDPGWPEEIIPAARALGDDALLAGALALGAVGSLFRRMNDLAPLDEAAALADSLPDERMGQRLDALLWVGWACAHAGRLVAADRHLVRALRLVRSTGQLHMSVYIRFALGGAWCLRGRLVEADRCLAAAVEAARLTGSDELLIMTTAQRSWVLSWRREEELARRLASEAATSVGVAGLRGGRVSVLAGSMLARAMAFAGDPDGCVQLLQATGGGSDLPEVDPVSRVAWLALLAEVEVERGRLAQARAAAALAEDLAGQLELPALTAFAKQAKAGTLNPAAAADYQLAAAALFADCGHRLYEGRARLLAAAALAAAGAHDLAGDQLDLAEALLTRGEATACLDQVHRQRRRIGPQSPGSTAMAQLSEREREIAKLIAAGRTNREIAEVLFLSARTVEAHLTRIFGKLGVTSRVSLAALYAGGRDGG